MVNTIEQVSTENNVNNKEELNYEYSRVREMAENTLNELLDLKNKVVVVADEQMNSEFGVQAPTDQEKVRELFNEIFPSIETINKK